MFHQKSPCQTVNLLNPAKEPAACVPELRKDKEPVSQLKEALS